jgi:hypothetical protein
LKCKNTKEKVENSKIRKFELRTGAYVTLCQKDVDEAERKLISYNEILLGRYIDLQRFSPVVICEFNAKLCATII